MASSPYFDDVESSLNKLPEELEQNLKLMLDLDTKSTKLIAEIDKMSNDYTSNIKKYSLKKQKKIMKSIQSKYDEVKSLSDDKVQISIQNYTLVDKSIINFDNEMSKFEERVQLKAEIQEKALNDKQYLNPKKGCLKIKSEPSTDQSNSTNSVDNVAVTSGASFGDGIALSAYVDMPIDPNEPTFCLCKKVSFGEMIGCTNPDCDIEWFHFKCVNLITKPEGEWFCPNCRKNKKKK
ncbi:unnamed protein product [Macrosiphum euphorbiae]|uniref:Inhibitor of growth protein n=1 Tax=Macrosiphum euphorbiae TaxID=13131 RepID=A0AAV0WCR8_9HEMI|nr:unnamed protein product [Macrosiphum euphorbiae]